MLQKTVPILQGSNFSLRPAHLDDAQYILRLPRNPAIHRMFGGSASDLQPYRQDDALCFVRRLVEHPCAWVIDADGVIGEARLDRIDMHDRRASFAIGILDPLWLGKGVGTEATKLVLGFAFRTLHLHRIGLRVLAYNTRAIRSYERCGFVVEGREREAGFVDGVWHDDVIMGILDRDFVGAAGAGGLEKPLNPP